MPDKGSHGSALISAHLLHPGPADQTPASSFRSAYRRPLLPGGTRPHPAYGEVIAALKKEGTMPRHVEHREAKYLNNRLEADHGQLKRLIRPTLGFKSMRSARATIAGLELMRMFRKGQFRFWIEAIGGGTEVRFINRLFGLYA